MSSSTNGAEDRAGLWENFRDAAMGLNFLLATLPNIVVTIIFLLIFRAAEDRRTTQQRQLDIAGKLLEAASKVVFELYPPGAPPSTDGTVASRDLIAAEKDFEQLYWGKLGLTSFGPAERCLTELHQMLAFAVARKTPSRDETAAFNQLELKLAAVAAGMRRELYGQSLYMSAASAGGAAPPGECGQ